MSGHGGSEANGWIGPGITVAGLTGARARIQANAEGLPNRGEIGMLQEFDAQDAEGKRSSASYASWGHRISMDMLMLGMVDGTIDRTDPATRATMQRIDRGHVDLAYKSANGYWSFAHNGEGGNNDVWRASTHADAWGYNHEIWPRIVKPWLDAG